MTTDRRRRVHDGAAAEDRPLAGLAVLLAEDQPEMRAALSATLERLGAEVEAAPDAEAALEALRRADRGWRLLVTDFEMPRMSGADLAARVRAARPELGVVCVTGLAAGDGRLEAARGLFDAVVAKPAPRAALAEAALGALRSSGLARSPSNGLPRPDGARTAK